MFIYVNVDIGNGYYEGKMVEISDNEIVKLMDRYFELKGVQIQEIGILGV